MAIELRVPSAMEKIVAQFDESHTPCAELKVSGVLKDARKALGDVCESENLGAWAEVLAFTLLPVRRGSTDSPWGTYFGPMSSATQSDGTAVYFPDIGQAEPAVIDHWRNRAQRLTHPVLKARYADLVWDLGPLIAQTKPEHEMARMAIDAYLDSLTKALREDVHSQYQAAIRGLDLAITLNDAPRRDCARAALLLLHRQSMGTPKGMWWKAWDRLIDEKRTGLTQEERNELVADLESVVARCSSRDPAVFDPHATQDAAKRLIKYYTNMGNTTEARRLHEVVGRTSEHFASLGNALLASSVLQTAVNAYHKAGMPDESRRVRSRMEDMIRESHGLMKPITIERTISADDMGRFVKAIIGADYPTTFVRIASQFLDRRDAVEKQVHELAEHAPLLSTLTQTIVADNHVAAKVGSVEDDFLGRVILHAKQLSALSEVWLLVALDRAKEVHDLRPEHFVGWVAQAQLFSDLTLCYEGVSAWYDQDDVKAIHVLVPQIEGGLRQIATRLGQPITKPHPKVSGVSVAIGMGDMLYSAPITDALGPDLTLHLLALYADPRGFNLRNDMAHGLLAMDRLHRGHATRLIHTLLVLGIWDRLAEARKRPISN